MVATKAFLDKTENNEMKDMIDFIFTSKALVIKFAEIVLREISERIKGEYLYIITNIVKRF